MRTDLPSGTVTFLFTDIEGSTRLLHELGPDAYAAALAEHRRVLRETFGEHGGVEVDTQGDAFFVAFPTAEGAASAALDGQAALASGPIHVRMGLHTGAPTISSEGYVGVDVHRAARVTALAHGRQILASPTTAALLEGAALKSLGRHRLKDFDGATTLFQLGEGGHPPLRTTGSVELPSSTTRFVGRERELFASMSLVYERDPFVLTILGPGGAGKTRFVLELARLLAEDAAEGTVFVPLAPLRDPALAVAAIAERLGASAATTGSIAAHVGDRRTHLVVDNAEHLLPELAQPLSKLVSEAPSLRLFVTSREALRVRGETEFDLPPMADGDAVALFVDRAAGIGVELEPSATIRELCARLDDLPLALELAAARTKLLTPAALLERLEGSLDLLKGTRDADERHATLRATIAWSYDLLDENERQLFARLAVFRGSCTLGAAEAVCDADLDVLGSLLDKNLVRRRTDDSGEDRYWMLGTVKAYALERLRASGEERNVRRRHLEWALALAESASLYVEATGPFRHNIVLADREDVRAALDWAAENDPRAGLQLAMLLENLWAAHSPVEGMERMQDLITAAGPLPDDVLARALRVRGSAAIMTGDLEAGRDAYERSLTLYEAVGDELDAAIMEHRLAAAVVWHRGDWDEVRRPSEHALDVFGRHRFARGIAQAQGTLAMAGRLWGAAAAADERRGGELTEHSQTRPLRESTESVVVDAEAEGRALDLWDAVDLALGEARQTVP